MKLTASRLTRAFRIAAERGLLPTALGSAELREAMAQGMWQQAVFSARTTSLEYLGFFKGIVDRLIEGGRNNDLPQLRLELKQSLQGLGYMPETGFPGDAALGIEPAEPGSIQDLSADVRLNLKLRTQLGLLNGKAQQLQGLDAIALHFAPCWELVRIESRRVPRGSVDSGSPGWEKRWVECGGVLTWDNGRARMIALKTDPIWLKIGSLFPDSLKVDHPPFAFNSGYGWLAVTLAECKRLGIDLSAQRVPEFLPLPEPAVIAAPDAAAEPLRVMPVPVALPEPPVKLSTDDATINAAAEAWFARFRANHGWRSAA